MPLVVLCRRGQRYRDDQHSDGEEPGGWSSHDSSNTHLATCREKRGRLQAYLQRKIKNRCERASVHKRCHGFPHSCGAFGTHARIFIDITIKVLILTACLRVAGLKTACQWVNVASCRRTSPFKTSHQPDKSPQTLVQSESQLASPEPAALSPPGLAAAQLFSSPLRAHPAANFTPEIPLKHLSHPVIPS